MMVLLVLLGVALAALVYAASLHMGKVTDKNKNFIPDSVDDKITDVTELVEELTQELDELKEEAKDVVEVIKPKNTKKGK